MTRRRRAGTPRGREAGPPRALVAALLPAWVIGSIVPGLTTPTVWADPPTTEPEPSPASTPAPAPAASPIPAATLVDQQRLMALIRSLPAKRSGTGSIEHHRGLAETEELIAGRLRDLGLDPELDPIPWAPPHTRPREGDPGAAVPPVFRNIIVEWPGADLPREVLIISAHLDAVPASPGADDDGTGVAALVEIATVLRDRPLRRTVRLIFFNLEEAGLIGSTHYVMDRRDRLLTDESIVGMVSLDMLGYFSTEPGSQRSPIPAIRGVFDPPTTADFLGLGGIAAHRAFSGRLVREMTAASPGLKIVAVDFLPVAPPDLLRSDHAPFLAIGLPAVILSDTANFRSPHYHRSTDTADTIDADRFTAVVRGLVGAVEAIAEPAAAGTSQADR